MTGWLFAFSSIPFLALLPFSGYVAALPFVQREWEIGNAGSAVVFSAYLAGWAVASLALVALGRRAPPRRILIAGVALSAASNLLFPLLAGGIATGSLLRFAAGAGHVGIYVPGLELVSRRFARSHRGAAVGIFVSLGYAGTTLSYVLMGALLDVTGSWRAAYLLSALPGAPALLLSLWLADREPEPPRAPSSASASDPRGSLRDPSFVWIVAAYALHTAELYLARLWFPQLLGAALVHSGREPSSATALATSLSGLMFMTGIAGVFLGGLLSDRWGRTRAAISIFAASGVCSLLAGWTVTGPLLLLVPVGFVYGFSTAADSVIYSTAVTELSSPRRMGSALALQSFIGFGAGALAPFLAGWLMDAAPAGAGWKLAFGFNGLLAAGGIGSLVALERRSAPPRRKSQNG